MENYLHFKGSKIGCLQKRFNWEAGNVGGRIGNQDPKNSLAKRNAARIRISTSGSGGAEGGRKDGRDRVWEIS